MTSRQEHEFHHGRKNIIAGALGLTLAACGGMALGLTFDKFSVKEGYHMMDLMRFYLREGHSHGMPIAIYNLVVGLLVDRWFSSARLKQICSYASLLGFLLPFFLAMKGAAGAPPDFPPIGIIGALGLLTSFLLIALAGARTTPK